MRPAVSIDCKFRHNDPIPARAGIGFKPQHFANICAEHPDIGWFEVHAENYMEAGGPPHKFLSQLRASYPLSVHGVGMSIGAEMPLDEMHLERLKRVCERYQPALVSEHLAWSTHDGVFFNDLLPLPYTQKTLQRVCDHVDHIQSTLKRQILIENPSTYIAFTDSEMTEVSFLYELAKTSGCGLLLDVNNVFVSATNQGYDPLDYIDKFPLQSVGEIHLGGHAVDTNDEDCGAPLLIDTHGCEIADAVWELFGQTLRRTGPLPVLIEWDNDVPRWNKLHSQAMRADAIMQDLRCQHDLAIAQ